MTFDFDSAISRTGTSSIKWEFVIEGQKAVFGDRSDRKHGDDRLLPMWVADMDFQCPPAVTAALQARAAHGIFGYSAPTDRYYEAVQAWMARRYGRPVEREWLVLTPGVVVALYMLVQTFVAPGEKVLVQRPVYHPFMSAIESGGAEVVSNSLLYADGRYQMDFADLAAKAADPAVKMAILCSPHNPVGRVWTAAELTRFRDICRAHDVLVVSDEIHCDLLFEGVPFTSYGLLDEQSIICTAPSKTFNLAGLKTSNVIIPDGAQRARFAATLEHHGIHGANPFGLAATEAAYTHGEPWLATVMAYVGENYRFLAAYVAAHLPQLRVVAPEGTYLVWVDCRGLGLTPAGLKQRFMEQARVYLNEGEMFGPEGEGFVRLNIACPRSTLAEALERIRAALG